MLVRLLYASRAIEPITSELMDAILQKSQVNNAGHGITGILCAYTRGEIFLQALEGGRAEINRLYRTLLGDPRHADVTLLHYAEITQRVFSSWRMGRVDLTRVNTGTILRYGAHSSLDPFSLTGEAAMALVMELATTTTVVTRNELPRL